MTAATHHGPWCDEGPPQDACKTCRRELPVSVGVPTGVWLLARLAVHHAYNEVLAPKRQEPLPGTGLRHISRLEVARLTLELAEAKVGPGPRSVR